MSRCELCNTRLMFNLETNKTVIEWNKYPDKIPEFKNEINILICDIKKNISQVYVRRTRDTGQLILLTDCGRMYPYVVKFWAYMPKGPNQ